MRALALLAIVVAVAPSAARADERLGRALADPGDGALVLLRSASPGERVEVGVAQSSTRSCRVPCSLRLAQGRYELRFASGPSGALEIDDLTPRLVVGRALDTFELGLGIAALVIGVVALAVVLATVDETCWRTDGSCSLDYGPLGLGIGVMGVAVGAALVIDSFGGVTVTELPTLHRR